MPVISIDFETRSTVDLTKTGVYPYAEHPTTDVWCMAYAVDDGPVQVWVPGDKVPQVIKSGARFKVEFRAWNAMFERIIWREIMVKRYGFPELDLEQWVDTAAEGAALALPRSLGKAAGVLGLAEQKDDEGRRLMLQMAKPRRPRKDEDPDALLWWDEPDKIERLIAYCIKDVEVERAIAGVLKPLSDFERQVYLLDQKVNDRGVALDVDLIAAAQGIVAEGMARANEELEALTGGISVTQVAQLKEWLKHEGLADLTSLSKAVVRDILDDKDRVLPGDVERALEIRAEASKSSNSKLEALVHYRASDNRAHGLLLYHGASTGRWTGKGPQPQNFPRGTVGCDPFCSKALWGGRCDCGGLHRFIPWILAGDYEGVAWSGPPLAVVSSLLRGMLRASPGHRLMAGDFSQIEARVIAWIAGQWDLVELFEGGGKVYETMAAFIFNMALEDIAKDSFERQIGKNSVLGCGFQMGADRFADQVWEQTGIVLERGWGWVCDPCGWDTDEETEACPQCGKPTVKRAGVYGEDMAAKAVKGYRTLYAKIPEFWRDINDAAFAAVSNPGSVHVVGHGGTIKWTMRGQFLWCQLPSGRYLAYALPRIQMVPVPWDDEEDEDKRKKRPAVTYAGVNSTTGKWYRRPAYGGLLTENVVQAMARDLMASAMLRLEAADYPVVLTVHDEIVCDVPDGHGSMEDFMRLLLARPAWAKGLPVTGEGWEWERYKK